ncbi:3905_t:CDS:2 [Funneliformis geosporum]|uniref:3905_t:CDS:1 n=1 Tax=Funneliformis geosporum TaxID=1117311 RepID=A0A9W4SGG7_9GLOM|nr:3905_t:CDS:2 [Funneliformis geosporum]
MAYQLELTRLSNFEFTPCFTDNRQIHVYYAVDKENASDCKPKQVEEAVKGFIDRHGKRLWRLRLTGAEVRFKAEDPTLGTSYPLRVIINNVSGYVVKVETYQEVQNLKAGFLNQLVDRNTMESCISSSSNLKYSSNVLEAKELVIIIYKYWSFGTNSFGMVANIFTLFTPEYSKLAEEVINHFNVALIDKGNPSKYIEYLYLDLETYKQLHQNGRKSGSGLIARIASRAYEDIFTITLVTCRSVGSTHNINGAPALNKVLGREVYTGNLEAHYAMALLCPAVRNSSLPIFMNSDTWDRDLIGVYFQVSKGHVSRDSKICILYRGYTYQLQAVCICLYCSNGELHGGDWVVMDPTINDDMMEMYADEKSRAGVLEPEGIVEIKFRKPQLLATIENVP